MKIMIVDDNSKIRRLVRSIMEMHCIGSVEIVFCANGYETFEKYQSEPTEWIIMDIQMPVMNGLEAAKKILAHNKKEMIILITNHKDPNFKERANKIGVKHFVQKENLTTIPKIINQIKINKN